MTAQPKINRRGWLALWLQNRRRARQNKLLPAPSLVSLGKVLGVTTWRAISPGAVDGWQFCTTDSAFDPAVKSFDQWVADADFPNTDYVILNDTTATVTVDFDYCAARYRVGTIWSCWTGVVDPTVTAPPAEDGGGELFESLLFGYDGITNQNGTLRDLGPFCGDLTFYGTAHVTSYVDPDSLVHPHVISCKGEWKVDYVEGQVRQTPEIFTGGTWATKLVCDSDEYLSMSLLDGGSILAAADNYAFSTVDCHAQLPFGMMAYRYAYLLSENDSNLVPQDGRFHWLFHTWNVAEGKYFLRVDDGEPIDIGYAFPGDEWTNIGTELPDCVFLSGGLIEKTFLFSRALTDEEMDQLCYSE
jgi:hypothetical protein